MGRKFVIVLDGVDTMPNHSLITQTIRRGLKDLFKEANRDLEIVVSHGLIEKKGDLRIDFSGKTPDRGPHRMQILGEKTGRDEGVVHVDLHRSWRVGGGVHMQVDSDKGRQIIGPDYITQRAYVFEHNDPALARFMGYTALHEIGHILGHKGSPANPDDIMYEGTQHPDIARWSIDSARRYWSKDRSFLTDNKTMIETIKTLKVGTDNEFKIERTPKSRRGASLTPELIHGPQHRQVETYGSPANRPHFIGAKSQKLAALDPSVHSQVYKATDDLFRSRTGFKGQLNPANSQHSGLIQDWKKANREVMKNLAKSGGLPANQPHFIGAKSQKLAALDPSVRSQVYKATDDLFRSRTGFKGQLNPANSQHSGLIQDWKKANREVMKNLAKSGGSGARRP